MGKKILVRMAKPSYWYKDQLPHWGISAVISVVVSCSLGFGAEWNPVVSALVGKAVADGVGYARELAQNWNDEPEWGSTEDSTVDMIFWTFGSWAGSIPMIWA